MPFINGRFYANPAYGRALERARAAEAESEAAAAPPSTPVLDLGHDQLERLKEAQTHQEGFARGIVEPKKP